VEVVVEEEVAVVERHLIQTAKAIHYLNLKPPYIQEVVSLVLAVRLLEALHLHWGRVV
jgi:hypothetical protein